MTKHKFAIGEKIAVYLFGKRHICIVTELDTKSRLTVRCLADDEYFVAHHKQCRKLVKKSARTWWLWNEENTINVENGTFVRTSPPDGGDWIKVREVRRKK